MKVRSPAVPRSSRLVAVIMLVAVAALALAGVAAGESSPPPDEKVTLRIGWLTEPDNLNPFVGIQGSSYQIWKLNYDLLVGFDDKTMEPRPELATAWEVSDDGTEWTFTIREGATWHDGEPVTASDVAFTLNYIRDNELLNLATYTDGILDAQAVDDTTVVVTTDGPKANMLRMLVPILPEHIWSKVDGKDAAGNYQNDPPIVGSGPFQTVEWVRGKFIRLEPNEGYWGGAPKIDELIFQVYTNPDTMVTDLELGTIDGAIDVPVARFAGLQETPGIEANEATSWQFIELAMNCYDSPDSKGNPVLLDPQFRQAVNWAVDREKVAELAFQGYATVGSTILPPYTPYHWEPPAESAFGYDPERANALLDDAGYEDVDGDGYRETKDGEKLVLRFNATTDAVMNQTAGKLIVGWLKDIGVELDYEVVDAGTLINYQYEYTGDTYTPNWDLFIWYWTQDVDPNFIVDIYTPAQIEGWNDCLWTDEEYTALNEQQKRTIDPAARIPLIQRMQEIFYNGAAYAVLVYPYLLEAYDTGEWEGWVHFPGEAIGDQQGAVLYSFNNVDTYRFVQPKSAAEDTSAGGTDTVLIAVIVILAIAVAVVSWLLLRRRGGGREEEA
ncbi:MAG TPA: ABC transporter substrate-binding protein [Thermoleophilia bacterium]|nr:ABC transporter substrate-binding protein [Thermoleophilia bacterium]